MSSIYVPQHLCFYLEDQEETNPKENSDIPLNSESNISGVQGWDLLVIKDTEAKKIKCG